MGTVLAGYFRIMKKVSYPDGIRDHTVLEVLEPK